MLFCHVHVYLLLFFSRILHYRLGRSDIQNYDSLSEDLNNEIDIVADDADLPTV